MLGRLENLGAAALSFHTPASSRPIGFGRLCIQGTEREEAKKPCNFDRRFAAAATMSGGVSLHRELADYRRGTGGTQSETIGRS